MRPRHIEADLNGCGKPEPRDTLIDSKVSRYIRPNVHWRRKSLEKRHQHVQRSNRRLFSSLCRRLISAKAVSGSPTRHNSFTYLLPRNAHTPQFPQLISIGSKSFRSHLRLLNLFSPGSINRSTSPAHFSITHFQSLCISQSVYPVQMMGTFVLSSCGNVSSHSCALAG